MKNASTGIGSVRLGAPPPALVDAPPTPTSPLPTPLPPTPTLLPPPIPAPVLAFVPAPGPSPVVVVLPLPGPTVSPLELPVSSEPVGPEALHAANTKTMAAKRSRKRYCLFIASSSSDLHWPLTAARALPVFRRRSRYRRVLSTSRA